MNARLNAHRSSRIGVGSGTAPFGSATTTVNASLARSSGVENVASLPVVEDFAHGSVERTGPAKQAMRVGACGARTTIEVFSIGTAHSGATMFQYSSS